ncbi:kinase-like domain-containing protein, partial [Tribonema minus]
MASAGHQAGTNCCRLTQQQASLAAQATTDRRHHRPDRLHAVRHRTTVSDGSDAAQSDVNPKASPPIAALKEGNNSEGASAPAARQQSGSSGGADSLFEEEGSDGYASPCRASTGSASSHTSSSSCPGHQPIRPGRWRRGELIGSGSFGKVYKAMNSDSGVEFAVKEVSVSLLGTQEDCLDGLTREIEVMRGLQNEHIVRYLGFEVSQVDAKLLIFQEWVPGNSLSSRLSTYGKFSTAMTRRYTRQILCGLAYLHGHGVMHMDIKCENLLLDKGGVVKLADFGTAAKISETGAQQQQHGGGGGGGGGRLGTPYFMAPEVLIARRYTPKADIWSVGGAVLQMTTLRAPWQGMGFRTPVQLQRHMAAFRLPPALPRGVPAPLRDFMRRCFAWAPEDRPAAAALALDPFLA